MQIVNVTNLKALALMLAPERTRYAFDCIHLDGRRHAYATDGKVGLRTTDHPDEDAAEDGVTLLVDGGVAAGAVRSCDRFNGKVEFERVDGSDSRFKVTLPTAMGPRTTAEQMEPDGCVPDWEKLYTASMTRKDRGDTVVITYDLAYLECIIKAAKTYGQNIYVQFSIPKKNPEERATYFQFYPGDGNRGKMESAAEAVDGLIMPVSTATQEYTADHIDDEECALPDAVDLAKFGRRALELVRLVASSDNGKVKAPVVKAARALLKEVRA